MIPICSLLHRCERETTLKEALEAVRPARPPLARLTLSTSEGQAERPPSSECSVELVQQFSASKCVRGSTFGCDNLPLPTSTDGSAPVPVPVLEASIWVQDCRGRFRCGGSNATVDCGFKRMPFGRRHNCSCPLAPHPSPPTAPPLPPSAPPRPYELNLSQVTEQMLSESF